MKKIKLVIIVIGIIILMICQFVYYHHSNEPNKLKDNIRQGHEKRNFFLVKAHDILTIKGFPETRSALIKKYSKYSAPIIEKIKRFAKNKVKYNDKELIDVISKLIDYPSERNYIKTGLPLKISPQATEIDAFLKQKRNGFFVEAGAHDGEALSNSIFFERDRGWTGLLVEMDPYYYLQLLGKNRRAYSINSCISLDTNVNIVTFQESSGSLGKIKDSKGGELDTNLMTVIPCFPLLSILLAINVTQIDYFSLDVEGFEMPILKYMITDKNYNIDVLSVEYAHGDKAGLKNFMQLHNYKVIKDVNVYKAGLGIHAADFIFAKI